MWPQRGPVQVDTLTQGDPLADADVAVAVGIDLGLRQRRVSMRRRPDYAWIRCWRPRRPCPSRMLAPPTPSFGDVDGDGVVERRCVSASVGGRDGP